MQKEKKIQNTGEGFEMIFQCKRESRWMILEIKCERNEACLRNERGESVTKRRNKERHVRTLFKRRSEALSKEGGPQYQRQMDTTEIIFYKFEKRYKIMITLQNGLFKLHMALEVLNTALGELELLVQ